MKQKKLKILAEILGGYSRANDEFLFQCPYCDHHKRKLSINIDKNLFKCWRCDTRGRDVFRVIRKFGNHNHKSTWLGFTAEINYLELEDFLNPKEDEKQIVEMPKEFISLANKKAPLTSNTARNYLSNRGLTKQDIIWWKMGYCSSGDYEGRVVIPSFDEDGDMNYFVSRSYDRKFYPRYKNPPVGRNIIFNDLFVDWTSNIVLVEGVFDAVVAGRNAIPLLGSTVAGNSKLLEKIVKKDAAVYIAMDPDAKKKELEIIKTLLDYDIEVWRVEVGDHEDVGSMTKQQFSEKLENAALINSENYLMLTLAMSL
jgi:DNA primase